MAIKGFQKDQKISSSQEIIDLFGHQDKRFNLPKGKIDSTTLESNVNVS